MKNIKFPEKFLFKRICLIVLVIVLSQANLVAQDHFTPYDELNSVNKAYKPSFSEAYPQWAKMLYEYPINFHEIDRAYNEYNQNSPKGKKPIIRYYKLWRRAIAEYVAADGSIILPDNLAELQSTQYTGKTTVLKNATVSNANWTFFGPKETYKMRKNSDDVFSGSPSPWQANVYSFDVAASDNNILYCGTETGFVNKTINLGEEWTLVGSDYVFGGGITAIAIHPENPDIVYAAAANQIHKTIDGGNNWIPLLPADMLFRTQRMKISSVNSNKIIAAATEGVYISNDNGVSWTNKWAEEAYDVEFKADDSSVLYAITKNNSKTYTVIESLDGGDSFHAISEFPSDIAAQSGGLLAVTPAAPDALYAIMLSADNEGTPYLYKGERNGNAWTWIKLAQGNTSSLRMSNGQGYFDLVLEVAPDNENIIFAGTVSLYKSYNGGSNFFAIGGSEGFFPIHADIQDMKILPNGITWVSTDGGINYSPDHFTDPSYHQAKIKNLIGSDMWGFDQAWNEDLVVGGRYHNGNTAIAEFYNPMALYVGGAESPTGWVLQGKSRHAAFDDLGTGWILPKNADGVPEGRFLFSKYPNMDEYGGRRSNLIHHPLYYEILYVGEGNGFWKSEDEGQSYDLIYTFPGRVRHIQASYSNPSVMYADVVGYGLYRTSDGGVTWTGKPSLTGGSYGDESWNGALFFAISPYDENTLYACYQNGTWSTQKGQVYKSTDGGDNWTDWTGSAQGYTKNIIIQPDSEGKTLVYLFTTSKFNERAVVYCRHEDDDDWSDFTNNLPAGTKVNLALPFFRDSKIRLGGTAGVWETPLQVQAFSPIITPWCQKPFFDCADDPVYFDDHSMLNHEGAEWEWRFSPEPEYINDANIRNPTVVFGKEGTYDVSLSVTVNGKVYTREVPQMVTLSGCPSIDDCSNPVEIPKDNWSLVYVNSQELSYGNEAFKAYDNDASTFWHTAWSSPYSPDYPHDIQIDLGSEYELFSFKYLPRQDGSNGRIKEYELYLSNNENDWGTPVSSGMFEDSPTPQEVTFAASKRARYMRLKALSEVNGNKWASAAELSLVGCNISTKIDEVNSCNDIKAYPMPISDILNLELLYDKGYRKLNCTIVNIKGQVVTEEVIGGYGNAMQLDVSHLNVGMYFLFITDGDGEKYRVKLVKK